VWEGAAGISAVTDSKRLKEIEMMKRTFVTVIMMAAALMLASAPANGQRRPKAADGAVMEAEQAYVAALVKGDHAALSNILDEQYAFTNTEGSTLDKGTHLKRFEGGTYKFATSADIDDVKIRVSGTTAFVTGRLNFVGSDTPPPDGHSRYTHVWVKKAGHWRLISNHSHRVS
jgi:ketosteroid isomerase-like protein